MKKSIKHSSYGTFIWNEGSEEIGISVSRGSRLLVVGSCLLVEESMFAWNLLFCLFKHIASNERGDFCIKQGEILFAPMVFSIHLIREIGCKYGVCDMGCIEKTMRCK